MKKVLAILLVMAVAVVGLFAANDGATVNLLYAVNNNTGFKIVAANGAAGVSSFATAKNLGSDDLANVPINGTSSQAIKDVVAFSNKKNIDYTITFKGSAFQLGNSDSATASERFGYTITGGQNTLTVAASATTAAPSAAVNLLVLDCSQGPNYAKASLFCDIDDDADEKAVGSYTAVLTFNVVAP